MTRSIADRLVDHIVVMGRAHGCVVTTALGAALGAALGGFAPAEAQTIPSYVEYRADAIVGRGTALEGGLGGVIPAGVYVRVSLDGAAGVTWRDGATRASGRVDVIGRFLLDPFRERPVGLSLGGGVSVPYADGDRNLRPYLTAVLDVEGRTRHRVTPALQIGVGGGTRVGIVLRASPRRWR